MASTRIRQALFAVASTLTADGLPCRVVAGPADTETLLRLLLPRGRAGSAAVTVRGFRVLGAGEAGQAVLADLLIYLATYDQAGEDLAILERAERLAELIPGQQWGRPQVWTEPAGLPLATNQFAAVRDDSGPGGVSVWTLTWTQEMTLSAPYATGALDPNLLLPTGT
jgi:hypothetical protein